MSGTTARPKPLAATLLFLTLSSGAALVQAFQPEGPTAILDPTYAVALSVGEVRKVDAEAGKITLRHGPIENLDMPPMTMVFRVKDPAMLVSLRPGTKVRFKAEKIGGHYTVTELKP